ncbi:T9SS type A sorting domain-containing protein [Kordia sp.]|uniref:T9SS type A sorting domain-containing protein n=1 Tax=Kordia sp. TaxID=1965332 RepID=UPI003D2DE2D1
MKKTINIFIFSIFCLLASQLKAQDGYTYTLMHNGGYNFTVQAVPNASANNFATSVQSYGFTILVPDGVTITTVSSLGNAANGTFFDGNNVSQPANDGYLVTETLGSPMSLPAPSAGTNSDIYTFTVDGSPTSGTIYILENNSPLANAVTTLKSFMQADMDDDGMAMFSNRVDPNAAAVTAPSTFNLATLSIEEENILAEVSLYPNPAKDIVKLQVPAGITDIKIEVFDNAGKKIDMQLSSENTIDVSNIASGLYLVSIISNDIKTTKKLIVN